MKVLARKCAPSRGISAWLLTDSSMKNEPQQPSGVSPNLEEQEDYVTPQDHAVSDHVLEDIQDAMLMWDRVGWNFGAALDVSPDLGSLASSIAQEEGKMGLDSLHDDRNPGDGKDPAQMIGSHRSSFRGKKRIRRIKESLKSAEELFPPRSPRSRGKDFSFMLKRKSVDSSAKFLGYRKLTLKGIRAYRKRS